MRTPFVLDCRNSEPIIKSMRTFNDSMTGKPFVATTTRQALALFQPHYDQGNQEFSLQDVHEEALASAKLEELEKNIQSPAETLDDNPHTLS